MNINGGNEIEFVKLENLESGSAYKVVFTIVLYEGTNLLLTVEVAIIWKYLTYIFIFYF